MNREEIEALVEDLREWSEQLSRSAEIALSKPGLASTGPRVKSYNGRAKLLSDAADALSSPPLIEEAPDPKRHDRYFAEGRLLSVGKDDEGRETMTLEVDHAGGITLRHIWGRWPVTIIARDPKYSAPSLQGGGDLGSIGPSALHAEAEVGREPAGGAS